MKHGNLNSRNSNLLPEVNIIEKAPTKTPLKKDVSPGIKDVNNNTEYYDVLNNAWRKADMVNSKDKIDRITLNAYAKDNPNLYSAISNLYRMRMYGLQQPDINILNYANGGEIGDFLQGNAGAIGSTLGGIAGGVIGSVVVPGLGTAAGASLGSTLGGGIGNAIQGNFNMEQQEDVNQSQASEMRRMAAINNYNNRLQTTPTYGANFANGGTFGSNLSNAEYQSMVEPSTLDPLTPTLVNNIPTQYLTRQQMPTMATMASNPIGTIPVPNMEMTPMSTNPTTVGQQFAKNFMTSKYDDVPTSIKPGQRINPELVMKAREEQSRNKAIQDFVTTSAMKSDVNRNANIPQYSALQSMMQQPQNLAKFPYSKAAGGYLEETRNNPDITYYANGGTHETNPNGGINIGNKGQVEQDEVRYKNFIFSNRF